MEWRWYDYQEQEQIGNDSTPGKQEVQCPQKTKIKVCIYSQEAIRHGK